MKQPGTDYVVEGDPNTVDSFVACLAAVAVHFGRRSDYAYLSALSGTCFSPCHNRGEDCIGWKVDGGSAAQMGFMAQALGMSVEEIRREEGSEQAYFAQLQQTYQQQGKAVVLATWPAWSILAGWEDDPAALPFVTTPRFEGVVRQIWPPAKTRLAYALAPNGQPSDPLAVLRAALDYGAKIAAGRVVPGVANFGVDNYFGGELYGEIVTLAEQEYLCAGCRENGCFGRAARRIADGHQASLAFLKEAQTLLGSELPGLAAVYAGYQAMHEISQRYASLAVDPKAFDPSELRPRIAADFQRLKQLHLQTTELFEAVL